ncbi:hypothetical protein N7462_009484 [Penicillium macrosclerotiorum]|uniref:uncharacterized protein n=1 Tax=Penicillium macrosclerotiorum TaxID=303699 RepID=UPI002547B6DC|nr:uncharacterized protein N7462_009484 [Penicillium macrosclerotiorum]KAJ5674045.1 hypothetical protein N7462_009484 [Penicillium macrosclerotiorum]
MPSLVRTLLLGIIPAYFVNCHAADSLGSMYRIDVHSHAIPAIWKQAMISAGFPVKNGTLYNDGAPVPDWTLDSHISAMDNLGVNYSTITRRINLLLHEYTQTYPTRLGALCLLPLPHVSEAVEEIRFCMDVLKFVGVGLYTNANGIYLGDSALNPVFSALSSHNASVFVHPASPSCTSVALDHPIPMTEYPFDTVRAMENLLLTGQRAKYPDLKIIFAHGGGAMPYLATRIAGVATLSYAGGISFAETMAQLTGYYFDLASATSAIQLTALKSFIGAGKLVTGIDYPYVPLTQALPGLTGIQGNGNFTDEEMVSIKYLNALEIFPRISNALKLQ